MKRALVALFSFGLLAAMTGCVREPVTEADLVGSWVNGETVLALSADGTTAFVGAVSYPLNLAWYRRNSFGKLTGLTAT